MRKSARVSVAEREGDIRYSHSRAFEQLARDFEACLVDQFAEGRALCLQSAVQRPRLHGELTCNLFQGCVVKNHPCTERAANRTRHALPVFQSLLCANNRHFLAPLTRTATILSQG